MKMPLLVWFLQVIPESIAIAALVICMAREKMDTLKLIKLGMAYACAVYIVGWISFTPGVHVIILSAILGILAIIIGGLEMKQALIYSAIACALIVLSEYVLFSVLINFGAFTIEQIMSNNTLRIISSYPHTLLLILLAYVIRKDDVNLINIFKR